ncbi:MAG: putative DNA binding domain-containing protein [Acidobacteriota bacterium]|nr:putative DNA binding domain-containing protein [Acidobacteriota bacterium]
MTPEISERAFEEAIERTLLQGGPDAHPDDAREVRETAVSYGDDPLPGSFHKRISKKDYDRNLCLLPDDVLDFLLATQPKEWEKLKQHYGTEVKARFLGRLSREIARRGALDVLRNGVRDSGCKFRLAYFQPASGLNEELKRLHGANIFSVVRQLRFSESKARKTDRRPRNRSSSASQSVDLGLFLNGIPIFTAELKNPLKGQTVEDAIRQYKDRDMREPLFAYGRCLAHFAVDPEQVFVTTHLLGSKTRFLPFNQGRFGGAGNPPVPPTREGYSTDYLWERIWARDSILDLIRQFIQEVEEEDDRNRRTGKRFLIFPRYQQLDCVRRLVRHARNHGPGERYLIQHSAGSGKSYTIAWLAHQLSVLHDLDDRRVFDSVVVVTDRRVLDRQLQQTVRQFEQTLGVVENIDQTSRQLREALEAGRTIIVTTLQKFPVIADEIGQLPGKRFAVIADEAHSSQSGESTKSLKAVLDAESLEAAEQEEAAAPTHEEEIEDRVHEEIRQRGPLPNLSTFAFTATPKPKTLELFGEKQPNGKFEPFHLYSMRQAIEEGFILDVLASYTTYKAYWRLKKKIEDDPRYDKSKAEHLLKSFVELHPHAIREKIAICVEHFAELVAQEVRGLAKAMIVTRSRLHAVRTKLALDRYLSEKGHPWRALVAFSGTVKDGGASYTESGMNSVGQGRVIGERQTAVEFDKPEYRFLVVANKFQTGFDQPLLHTMYVDKKLGGVNAVQTLSRLNRTHPEKGGTMVLDFANEPDEIRKAFEPYYETTVLSEETDPNLLYEVHGRLLDFGVFAAADIGTFARTYFGRNAPQDRLYTALEPARQRFAELVDEEQRDFLGQLTDYVRLYAFLSQVLTFADTDLEKLYQFARHLRRLLSVGREALPLEVQQNIDMESFRIQRTSRGRIALERHVRPLEPAGSKTERGAGGEQLEALSRIIEGLNERFGLNLTDEHRVTLEQIRSALDKDAGLTASARVNTRENVRLTFDPKVEDKIQEIVETNFDLYKRITDDPEFGQALKDVLFEDYIRRHRRAEELLKLQESKTLEFKSSLRWSLKEDRKDDRHVTHAALKTIAAFLNTEGGDLLIGVDDDRKVLGIDHDRLESDDKFMRHLAQVVRNGLGDRAGTCIDPETQIVESKTVCLVSCQRSPEPVYLRWKGLEKAEMGDFFVRSGPGTVRLDQKDAGKYTATRFGPQ